MASQPPSTTRPPVLVQLATHKVQTHARAAGGARLTAQPLLLPLERAAWHHTLVLRAADLRPNHHLARRNDEGTRAGHGREGVRERERATVVRGRALLSEGRAVSRPHSPPYLGIGSPRKAGLCQGASAINHDGLVQHGGGRRGRSAAGRGVLCQHQRLCEVERPPRIIFVHPPDPRRLRPSPVCGGTSSSRAASLRNKNAQ